MTFEKLHEDAIVPHYQTIGSAGLDLHSIEATMIASGTWSLVGTGLKINLPKGTEGQVRSRSGLAAKHGISVLNSPGTIDEDYQGEIKVILHNASNSTFSVEKGDRIAQLVIAPVYKLSGHSLDNTREDNGFGSTGL
jgi:dUTP pyrophosphatase